MASARISCSVSSSKFFTSFTTAAKTQPNSRPTIIGSTEQNVVGHFRPGARLRCHSERSDVTPLLFAGGARVTLRSRGIPLSPISSEDAAFAKPEIYEALEAHGVKYATPPEW